MTTLPSTPPPTPTYLQTYDVLNELVLDRGPNAFLTNIEVWEKGRFITRVQADGIMLSTPTGGGEGGEQGWCGGEGVDGQRALTHHEWGWWPGGKGGHRVASLSLTWGVSRL